MPADAALLSSTNLSVNESLLTGEAIPVRKIAWDGVTEMSRPGGDDLPFVYSGTLVVQGRGIAQVQATGVRTEMGKIGKALQTSEFRERFTAMGAEPKSSTPQELAQYLRAQQDKMRKAVQLSGARPD